MADLQRVFGFSIDHAHTLPFGGAPIEWSCPACGVSGDVQAIDDVDLASEAIKAHHNLVSPGCLNSRHDLDVAAKKETI